MGDLIEKRRNEILASRKAKADSLAKTGKLSPRSSSVEVVFMFDTTASMYPYLEHVRNKMTDTLAPKLKAKIPDIKIGVVAFGDHEDEKANYLTKVLNPTSDLNIIMDFIKSVPPTHGGDIPEAIECALYEARQIPWTPLAKHFIVLIGDAPPNKASRCPYQRDYRMETQSLSDMDVKIYSVLCGDNREARSAFKFMATRTSGIFLNLENIDDIITLLVAVCLREAGILRDYHLEMINKGKLSSSQSKILSILINS